MASGAARLYNATVGHPAVVRLRPTLDVWTGGFSRPLIRSVLHARRGSSLPVPSELRVRLRLPYGWGIERSDELLRPFEALVLASPAVERTLASVRDGLATLRILWHPEALATAEPLLVRDRLIEHAIRLTGVEVSVRGLVREGYSSGGGRGSDPFLLSASGSDYEELEEALERLADQIQRHARVSSVDLFTDRFGRPIHRPVISLQPREGELLRGQIDVTWLAGLLRTRRTLMRARDRQRREGRDQQLFLRLVHFVPLVGQARVRWSVD